MNSKKERIEVALKSIMGQGTADIESANMTMGEILSPNFMNNTPYAESLIVNLPNGTGQLKVNYTDDGNLGSISAYWIDEGAAITTDKGSFATKTIDLSKLACIVPLTNEISEDVPTLVQYLSKMITRAIKYKVNYNIMYGDNTTELKGILQASKQATYFVDTAVSTTINAQVNMMYKRYYGSDQGMWLFSKDKYVDLVDGYDADLAFSVDRPFGQLWGLPIYVVPYLKTGDVVLGDFSSYVIAQKEMRQSVSESIYFDSDQQALRIILRIGGQVPFGDGWTNEDGYKVYPFVALDDMEMDSSSSSSIDSSSSSSMSSESSSSISSESSSSSSESSSSSSSSSDSSESSSSV